MYSTYKRKKFDAHAFEAIEVKWLRRNFRKLPPEQLEACKHDVLTGLRPYIESVVHSMARRETDPVDDLVQVGCMGVLKALEHYDWRRGTAFKAYASFYISGEIRRYLREQTLAFKAPRVLQELYLRLNLVVKRFQDTHGRPPSDEELLKLLNCEPKDLTAVLELDRRAEVLSLNEILLPNEARSLQQAGTLAEANRFGRREKTRSLYIEELMNVADTQPVDRCESRLMLGAAIRQLAPELRDVVRLSFFEDLSQQEIASQRGVSQMQISRRLNRALKQLGDMLNPF